MLNQPLLPNFWTKSNPEKSQQERGTKQTGGIGATIEGAFGNSFPFFWLSHGYCTFLKTTPKFLFFNS